MASRCWWSRGTVKTRQGLVNWFGGGSSVGRASEAKLWQLSRRNWVAERLGVDLGDADTVVGQYPEGIGRQHDADGRSL